MSSFTRATPLRSAHAARFIPPFLQHTTDNYRPLTPQQLATPEGQAILELFRGDNPLALTTQLRTTWR